MNESPHSFPSAYKFRGGVGATTLCNDREFYPYTFPHPHGLVAYTAWSEGWQRSYDPLHLSSKSRIKRIAYFYCAHLSVAADHEVNHHTSFGGSVGPVDVFIDIFHQPLVAVRKFRRDIKK